MCMPMFSRDMRMGVFPLRIGPFWRITRWKAVDKRHSCCHCFAQLTASHPRLPPDNQTLSRVPIGSVWQVQNLFYKIISKIYNGVRLAGPHKGMCLPPHVHASGTASFSLLVLKSTLSPKKVKKSSALNSFIQATVHKISRSVTIHLWHQRSWGHIWWHHCKGLVEWGSRTWGWMRGGEGGPSCQKKVQHGSHDVGMACLEPTLSGGIGLQGWWRINQRHLTVDSLHQQNVKVLNLTWSS